MSLSWEEEAEAALFGRSADNGVAAGGYSSPADRACYNCGGTGHLIRDCPKALGSPGFAAPAKIVSEGHGGLSSISPWQCEVCGWQNKSINKTCGGGHGKYGCSISRNASTGQGMIGAGEIRHHAGEDGVVTEGVSVPSPSISLLVGKGGSQVKELMHKSGAVIQINKGRTGDPTQVVMITGPHHDVQAAKAIMKDIVDTDIRVQGRGSMRRRDLQPYPNQQPGDVVEIIQVPNRHVGGIIGPKGAVIHKMMAESGAYLRMDRDDHTDGLARGMTVAGKADAVAKAKNLVRQQVDFFENNTPAHENSGGAPRTNHYQPGQQQGQWLMPTAQQHHQQQAMWAVYYGQQVQMHAQAAVSATVAVLNG